MDPKLASFEVELVEGLEEQSGTKQGKGFEEKEREVGDLNKEIWFFVLEGKERNWRKEFDVGFAFKKRISFIWREFWGERVWVLREMN